LAGDFFEVVRMRADTQNTETDLSAALQATESLMRAALTPTASPRLDSLMNYHLDSGGSRVRAKLALKAGSALNLSPDTTVRLAACCELIHNASLLHDDIQDEDSDRRGQQAAWRRFDVNCAMCAGTLMLSAAYGVLAPIGSGVAGLIAHVHQRTSDLIGGQALDLSSQHQSLTLNDYIQIAAGKSGSLLALPMELAMIAGNRVDSVPGARAAGESFALAYQIADDLKDVERDRQQGSNNVVLTLQHSGLTPDQAMAQACDLAKHHLQLAVQHATSLDQGSGQYLCDLATDLSNALLLLEPKRAQAA
jgi:geranylgeranyl diphosphate synthase type I